MYYKKKFFIIALILFIILSVSVVSAEENLTVVSSSEENIISEELFINDSTVVSEQNENIISTDYDNSVLSTTYRETKISIDSVNVKYGDEITFKAHVQFIYGNDDIVPGKVTFSQGAESYTRNLDKEGYATLTLSKLYTPGVYNWTAKYNSYLYKSGYTECRYLESTKNFKLTVQGSTIIYYNHYNSYYNSGAYYQIKVLNKYDNTTVPNYKIKLDFYNDQNNYTTTEVTTDKNGIYKSTIKATPGNYKIVVSTNNNNYPSHKFTINVTVKKTPAYLTANNVVSKVTSMNNLKVNVKDIYNKNINEGKIIFNLNGNTYESNINNGVATYTLNPLKEGIYIVSARFVSDNYVENNVAFNLIVNKLSSKISTYKWISTTKQYATLKAIVKDSNNKNINEGTIKFSVNGKTYDVAVKNGVATKNIKLTKAKTYSYKATFLDDKYDRQSSSSKVFVQKAKKKYTYKYGKLKGKITYKQYTALLKAYNQGKYKSITVKTGKYNTYKLPKYKYKKISTLKWKHIKVLVSEYWSWDGGSQWEDYDDWKYYTARGWKWYGTLDDDDNSYDEYYSAHYYKLKKKVKVTEKKKIKDGYKKVKYPIRIVVSSTQGHNGVSIEFYDSHKGYLGGGLKNII